MEKYQLGVMESRFADLIWANAPVASGELVRLCGEEFGWKKSTTYTMLKRLCARGIFQNEGGTITPMMSKEELGTLQGEQFLSDAFGGSLPKFLAAFTRRNQLSEQEIAALEALIAAQKRRE